MKRHLRIFLSGVMVLAPIAVTGYAIWWAGRGLDNIASRIIKSIAPSVVNWWFPGAGVLFLLISVYVIGLLTHLWLFRWFFRTLEKVFSRLPIVKTIYESVRDVLKVFAGGAGQMGQVVRYRIPGTQIDLLGIKTSTSPIDDDGKVAVYIPMSYQLGGFTIYVDNQSITQIDMSVEQAMKIAATAGAASKQ